MYTMQEMVRKVKSLNASGMSWGDIAAEMYPNQDRENIRAVLWRIINDGYYPMGSILRERLGLAPMVRVEACTHCGEVHISRCPNVDKSEIPTIHNNAVVVIIGGGSVPPGAQVISAQVCACGQWFISNHPRRQKCFICSPYKGVTK
jgi:hypothetical protein